MTWYTQTPRIDISTAARASSMFWKENFAKLRKSHGVKLPLQLPLQTLHKVEIARDYKRSLRSWPASLSKLVAYNSKFPTLTQWVKTLKSLKQKGISFSFHFCYIKGAIYFFYLYALKWCSAVCINPKIVYVPPFVIYLFILGIFWKVTCIT